MKHGYLIALIAVVLLVTPAGVRAQGLPDSVAQAYRDYLAALEAGDAAGLLAAAQQAYEAGESEEIEAATLATLAENYGFAASANGQFETAQRAWRDAARLSDRAETDPVERAWRWHNAATLALRNSDRNDAYACSRNAVRALADMEGDLDPALDFAGDAYLTRSMLTMSRGRIEEAGEAAMRAIDVFHEGLDQPDARYALAMLYAGVAQTLEQDFEAATYSLYVSSEVYSVVNPDHVNAPTLRAALASAMHHLYSEDDAETEAAFARLNARVGDNPFDIAAYDRAALRDEARAAYELTDRPCCDAEPLQRRMPRYPDDAARSDLNGVVYVRFDVTAGGRTDDIEVIGAFPPGVFDRASIDAVRVWRYQPATRDGEAVRREGVETRFDYVMQR